MSTLFRSCRREKSSTEPPEGSNQPGVRFHINGFSGGSSAAMSVSTNGTHGANVENALSGSFSKLKYSGSSVWTKLKIAAPPKSSGIYSSHSGLLLSSRSEERRVGKECRSRWAVDDW